MEMRSGFILALFAAALLFSSASYALNSQLVSDDDYFKAYFNLYKSYITAEGPNTKDQLLDVIDYYLTAGDVSSDLAAVGSHSHQMIGSILAENGVGFDCGECNYTYVGAKCCIYRVGQVPVVYECVGSEISNISSFSWMQLWQCVNGCCKDRCCLGPNQSTTTLSTATSTTEVTSTTLAGGDDCIDDGDCYNKYGPCYICETRSKICLKKVICLDAQDCKERYDPSVDWTCDANGCCIPPAATTTTTNVLTTSSSVPSGFGVCKDCCATGALTCDVSCQNGRISVSGFPVITSCEYDGSTLTIVRGTNRQTQSCLKARCLGVITSSTAVPTSTTMPKGNCLPDNTPVGKCSLTFPMLRCVYDSYSPYPYFDYDITCAMTSSTTSFPLFPSTTMPNCDMDMVCDPWEDPDTCPDCFMSPAKCLLVRCGDGLCQSQIFNGYGESEENPYDNCCCAKDCPGVKCQIPLPSCNNNGVCDLGETPINCPGDCMALPANVKCSEACKGAKYYDCTQIDDPMCMYREEPAGNQECMEITGRQDSICCCGNCGDGICQSNTEDVLNCPSDCCPDGSSRSVNPQCNLSPTSTLRPA
jgi:hypothetical protein